MPITQTIAVLLACSLFAIAAQAQQTSAPTPADTAAAARTGVEQDQLIQQQREAQQREAAVNAPSVRSTREDAPVWPALPSETPCFRIDTFAFEIPTTSQETVRATAAETQPLGRFTFAREWVGHYAGACIGKQGLDALVKGLQKVVLSRGYLTTRVLLPEQDLASGTLRFALIPGVIHRVRFADPTLRGTWKSAFPTRDGALLDLRDLEQGLEQMKRVSNQDVSMQIVPADLPGQSDVVLDVTRTKPWTVVASVDNAGSRATGQLQGSLSAGVYNPLGLNDIFNVGVSQDLLFKDHDLGSRGWHGSYAIPWGYWSATLAAYTSRYHQRIAGVNETFIASGNAKTLDATLSRVLSRSQNHVFGTQLRLSRQFGQSFIEDIEITQQRRNNTLVEWGLTDRHYFGAAQLDAALAYRQGIGRFGAQDALLAASGGPTYRYRMAVLDANLAVGFAMAQQPVRYVTTVHGQYTGNTLYYIDNLSIGSRYTVRGFDGETMLSAARGFYWRNELQVPLGQTGQSVYAGLDYGRVWGPQPVAQDGTQLVGAVIGLKGSVATRFGGYGYDVFLGTPIYKPSGFPTAQVTVGFQLTAQL